VLFTREMPDSSLAIHLMKPDGSEIQRLKAIDSLMLIIPRVSPDGRRVVMVGFPKAGGVQRPYLMDRDGFNFHALPGGTGGGPASWSPDSRELVFPCIDDNHAEGESNKAICIIGVDGSNLRRINHSAFLSLAPAWSPDGLRIAYTSDSVGGDFDIYTMNPQGGEVQQVTDTDEGEAGPAWSPDGTRIAFWRSGLSGPARIHVIQVSGTGELPLSPDGIDASGPTWSPDGEEIWYSAQGQIHAVKPDASGPRQVTNSILPVSWPGFGPQASP
jgi:TolB protein